MVTEHSLRYKLLSATLCLPAHYAIARLQYLREGEGSAVHVVLLLWFGNVALLSCSFLRTSIRSSTPFKQILKSDHVFFSWLTVRATPETVNKGHSDAFPCHLLAFRIFVCFLELHGRLSVKLGR